MPWRPTGHWPIFGNGQNLDKAARTVLASALDRARRDATGADSRGCREPLDRSGHLQGSDVGYISCRTKHLARNTTAARRAATPWCSALVEVYTLSHWSVRSPISA